MFNKPQSPSGGQPQPTNGNGGLDAPLPPADRGLPRAGGPKVAALITDNVTVEGGISGDGELHVDGTIRGDVRVSRVTIGESGKIEGSVKADILEARGKVIGSIEAKQVRLYASAHVDGDITHEQLAMENGAFFQGRSLRFQREPKPATITPPAGVKSAVPPAEAAKIGPAAGTA
ncbi:MAG: polymer-forming cytoskeletal protein [Caulobacteraceae bacterium]|nr:polymer-forming cytoskeletal protein [Caulobacteraceae bacterium]